MFSIVIPLYNKEKHVAQAIASVFSQTRGEYEIIVVDDGCTDRSMDVVRTFGDPRLRRVHRTHENSAGGHAARNLGVREARHSLIAFLDADDEWLPDHLETIARLVENYPQCGAYATAYAEVNPDGRRRLPRFRRLPPYPWEGVMPSYFRSTAGPQPVWTSAVVVRKPALIEAGGFPEGVKVGGDLDTWARIALQSPMAFSQRVTALYHLHGENRVSLQHRRPEHGDALIGTLRKAISTGGFREGLSRRDLAVALNWVYFRRVRECAQLGERKKALRWLAKARPTPGSARAFLFSCALLLTPAAVLNVLGRVRRFMLKER